jgi:CheY-like chemotaxis protein
MPDMSGLEVFEQVRSGRAGRMNSDVPFIAVTGQAMSDDKERILSKGLDGYLVKPVSLDNLRAALASISG